MVLGGGGRLGTVIELRDWAAKKGGGRSIPINPSLAEALRRWAAESHLVGPIIPSVRGGHMTPLSIVVWFNRAYKAVGLKGCSSHSGRRTFITRAARLVHRAGGSLRDVQLLAGHQSIQTTQRYIDGRSDLFGRAHWVGVPARRLTRLSRRHSDGAQGMSKASRR